MADLFDALPSCPQVQEPPAPRGRSKALWYRKHLPGWQPEPEPMDVAPRGLADATYNQMCSIRYAPATFIEEEMAGTILIHRKMGVAMRYEESYLDREGQLHRGGPVVSVAPGVGVAMGCHWAWRADRLEVQR